MAFINLCRAFDQLTKTVYDSLTTIFQQAIGAINELGEQLRLIQFDDPKAAARARSRADVRDKRKSMMKRRGRK